MKKIFVGGASIGVIILAVIFYSRMSYLLEDKSNASTGLYVMLLLAGMLVLTAAFLGLCYALDKRGGK